METTPAPAFGLLKVLSVPVKYPIIIPVFVQISIQDTC